ncbi:MAG: dihydrofolate reductase [Candidatus Harrisonbacteria bacterium]|nr:dihydrofolate reductase [Candidatus Harrisonbacteria bacterium]
MLALIVAMAKNRAIGKEKDIPWRMSADLKNVKAKTTGKTIIMGRKTHESILERVGGPLPHRRSIVITSQKDYQSPGVELVHSLEEALALLGADEGLIFGGASVYAEALEKVERMYVTEIDALINGDTFFPAFDENEWNVISKECHQKDDNNEYNYCFLEYERR